ncbi:multifunctional oxoglutarate decarboxylase/oxoglutarate dehydrogenase thiamine pyrophosphate-binding subunit/dihydrolipoyllysine-residue succinyltransferase subunit [Arsenicicoccus sp. oral taxon 190]|uniref:multifunctional oxoglutarate decarboxylase/oxoglutarate dehydrogenase thiamine pyrophosphate-binding subunit/dihydrolipoyllysine-residue succinyltransferase subunit n=1 Tax=Arsenicicoccus sp. oral taxon 190 TaxID=1658671 RepID=UPI00067A21D5|nr:multifunctional oxoglutarate decarboxylase/oxoglutarate dehydrogenase thiamine pyrophosphate-binding subunit/dihydrolipoyllysine-residue succinyltransferase subunit [Arsenicicoccus sp. oral taxon 190]AKT51419.1 alpha-ketoglutarate decarboxylase [Arsenicicoccus sp. oral taxon 190]
MTTPPSGTNPSASFGANQWLVDELYEQYKQDKNSVDRAWWSFFEDYSPAAAPKADATTQPTKAQQPKQPQQPDQADQTGSKRAPEAKPSDTKTSDTKATDTKATDTKAADTKATDTKAADAKVSEQPADRRRPTTPRAGDAQAQPTPRDIPAVKQPGPQTQETVVTLKGPAARVVTNMDASLQVPTATSLRAVPAKALIDNRIVINNHLRRSRGGKVSFTHIIGFALVKALQSMPDMNTSFTVKDGKPTLVRPAHVNLGIAIDLPKPDGTRSLVVPSIKSAEGMDFVHFWTAYEELVRKARNGKLTVDDFAGTTISLTNPGGIGTNSSTPRLMQGQGAIIGVGSLEYPAEWQGAAQETLNRHAVSKILTLTSTYDHRIIQGAGSGEFLKIIHELLLGQHGFYDEIFAALRIPYEPVRWVRDISAGHEDDINKTARVQQLIHAYRVRGHLMADIDPLEYIQRRHPDLDIERHGLTLWDLEREFATGGFGGKPLMHLRDILGILRDSYCRTIGVEYMHMQDPDQREWIQDRVEVKHDKESAEEQLRVLRRLNAAEAFETFLQTKFVGQKRFSLEGGESAIAVLDRILSRAAEDSMDEVCIGMPHRGRLNVLANIAGKSYGQIFREFEGVQDPSSVQGSGDVKYHLGTEGTFTSEEGKATKVYLAANPSHLEAVNPVLEGIVRAKQDRLGHGGEAFTVLPILMHGDAAFAGQGVVAETLHLSQLRGYRTGGTIHIVVNNQVGFTTAPSSSRSSVYSTDVARMIQAPIFHVNGDDPEACVRVAELAYEFRQRFAKDVVIDMVCYRRRGHNEGDDPSMTQPLMYNLIEAKRSVRKLYTEALIGRGDITVEQAEEALQDYQQQLERVFVETREAVKAAKAGRDSGPAGLERPEAQEADDKAPAKMVETAISPDTLMHIGKAFVATPEGFTVHPKLRQMLEKRADSVANGGIDWGTGELIAFGSLLMEGTPVRLAGQDSRRGTFVQRHSVLIDKSTAEEWTPLLYLGKGQARFWVYDSLLSEFAAVGFEYGYSVERPDALVLWEAQFGDFANGAQSIVDEFISSSEQKWGQRSSVVLLLPHGYEGQGPDHSSARIERYLQLCAQDNMTVAFPSTPASYFHLLRRQAYARPRRPLIVATPKSMLRLKAAASAPEDFTTGTFRPVIPDRTGVDPAAVTRVLLCSGKVYYELDAARQKAEDSRTAIMTVEQISPFPAKELAAALATYPEAEIVWVQDEPANQGTWPYVALTAPELLSRHGETRTFRLVSRPASAAPSTGSSKAHAVEQADLIDRAFRR